MKHRINKSEVLSIEKLKSIYYDLLNKQQFTSDPDYSAFEKQKETLQNLAKIGRSAISVFDLFQKKHIFYSSNYMDFLGYSTAISSENEQKLLDQSIHPDDYLKLFLVGIILFKLSFELTDSEKLNYKIVNDYRIKNSSGQFIRVLEQQQVLELDPSGNTWLGLSILDISPNQNLSEGMKSQLLNIKSGETFSVFQLNKDILKEIVPAITKRELQILQFVKRGLLSKEISDKLNISLHTVNTHRQRLLEKLGANNSIEAISFAEKYGLI